MKSAAHSATVLVLERVGALALETGVEMAARSELVMVNVSGATSEAKMEARSAPEMAQLSAATSDVVTALASASTKESETVAQLAAETAMHSAAALELEWGGLLAKKSVSEMEAATALHGSSRNRQNHSLQRTCSAVMWRIQGGFEISGFFLYLIEVISCYHASIDISVFSGFITSRFF